MPKEKKKTLAEESADAIRELIMKGELLPGEHINIVEMTRRLDFSKTPIREALKILVSEELVTYAPNVGYAVHEVDLQEYLQIYEIQELMETHLLRRMATMSYLVDFDRLKVLNDELAEMIARGDRKNLGEQNDKFHRAFYENYPNRILLQGVYDIWVKVRMQRNLIFQSPLFMRTAVMDHQEMMDTVRNEDPVAAEKIARVHYARGLESILTFFPHR